METIKFSSEKKAALVKKVQLYFDQELHQSIGAFDAEFLLDYFSEQLGVHYYNQGIQDAQVVISKQLDAIEEALYEIEKPI